MQVVIQSLITGLFVGLLGLWVNSRLEQLKGDLQSKMDALVRERELYEKLGPALRAFTPEGTAEQKAAFEEAYALAYIWASEEVLKPLDAFIATSPLITDRCGVPKRSAIELTSSAC
jgi:hypothetical protein